MIGFKELLIVGVIILLIFGSGKLRALGTDLGASIKGFKKAAKDETDEQNEKIENK